MKKFLVLGGIAAAMVAAAPAALAGTYQIGTTTCYVEVSTMEPNMTLTWPPTIDPEGEFGAGTYCPYT